MRVARWVVCGMVVAPTVVGAPLVGVAQEAGPLAVYTSLVRAANTRMPRVLALSPDGRWLASYGYEVDSAGNPVVAEVTVLATSGGDSSVVPLSGCSSTMDWAPTSDLLALTCRRTIYLWRRGADQVDTVAAAPAHGSIEVLTWQSAGRLIYATTTGPGAPRVPAQIQSRQAMSSASVSARRATSTDSSCAAIGIRAYTVPVLCSDSVDILRSRARERPINGKPVTSRRSFGADSTVTKVVVFDRAADTHTVVATIRGRPRDLVPTLDGQGVAVLASGERSSDAVRRARPSQRLYVVRFASSGSGAKSPVLLNLTDAPAASDPHVIRVLTDEPMADRGVALAPDGRTVAFLRSWYNGAYGDDVVEDTVFLASIEPNAAPEAVALNLTREAEADTSRALQWVFSQSPSTKTQVPVWTPDGTHLVVASHGHLWHLDAAARQAHRLSTGLERSVTGVLWVSNREALVATYDALAGRSGVWWVTFATGKWRRGYEVPQAASHVVATSGGSGRTSTVAYVGSTLRTPPNLYAVRLGPDGRRAGLPRPLMHDTVPVPMPATRDTVIAYQVTPDQWGTAFLVRPAAAEGPVATIVTGYPGSLTARSAARKFGFAAHFVAALARGYAVMLVDIPLPPFGKYGAHGPAAMIVRAVTAALDAAARTEWVDTTRLGVIGYSGGGWMVNLLVTRTQRFGAAVSGAGPADLVSYVSGGADAGPRFFKYGYMRMGEWLEEAPERYVQNSSILYLDDVTTPLLLIHGVQDERVHISQSEEMFRGLAQRGKVVELVRYHGAEHGCDPNGACRLLDGMWARAFDWFDEHLRAEHSPEESEAQFPTAME